MNGGLKGDMQSNGGYKGGVSAERTISLVQMLLLWSVGNCVYANLEESVDSTLSLMADISVT